MTEKGGDSEWLFGKWADVRGLAAQALSASDPDAVTEEDIWTLMRGSSEQQVAAAPIIARRGKAKEFGLLVVFPARWIRAVEDSCLANYLAGWVSRGIAGTRPSALLNTTLDNPGTKLSRAVVAIAQGAPEVDGTIQIVDRYKNYISASVRNAIRTIKDGAAASVVDRP